MRLRHADRAVVRRGSRPAGERRPGTRLPTAQEDKTCPHGIRLSCSEKYAREDDRLGEPLCPDCYDYAGAVLFNACAPELWRRFTITLRRTLARQAGLTGQVLATQVRVFYARVAEALAISRSKLYELLASGAIASIRIDGSRRIPVTALEDYVSRLLAERTAA